MSVSLGKLQKHLEEKTDELRTAEAELAAAKRKRFEAKIAYDAARREIAEAFEAVNEGTAVP